ncbi:T-lymphocyte activation antigen CD86-like isoform X1 [Vespula squamosa]|uniref:T-lymphocyte activation antigen CD86-like isoform X1 n=1 Tax=Vespula squamosa TaxID=30214 RepID=A0ABD2B064_VESSQ
MSTINVATWLLGVVALTTINNEVEVGGGGSCCDGCGGGEGGEGDGGGKTFETSKRPTRLDLSPELPHGP